MRCLGPSRLFVGRTHCLWCPPACTTGGPQPLANRARRALISTAGGSLVVAGLVAAGAATAAVAAAASGVAAGGSDPQALVRSGMAKFQAGDVAGSVRDFDAALAARPAIRPYLWQRGLSLYYLKDFESGASQFRDDVAVNPRDTEEAIWAFLCEAQLVGPEAARAQFLQVGRDPRPVMRAAYEAFRSGEPPNSILAAARGDSQGHDAFYALLYVGLWHEAHQDAAGAKEAIERAVSTQYSRQSGDYMAALARVHCKERGWVGAA